MNLQISRFNDRFWLYSSLVSLAILYLNLTWKATGDMDRLTTDSLFCGAILWLLWHKREKLKLQNNLITTSLGLLLLILVLYKSLTLFWFESTLLPLIPFLVALAMVLMVSGFRGIKQYSRELFFAWFLFFPTGVIGNLIDRYIHITVLNAKFATYLLYYVGFNVTSHGNEILLSLPDLGDFKAVVDYPCAGVPMILLMLKLALLLISFVSFPKVQQTLIPLISIAIGFTLGVIRVCILALMIPKPAQFDYWHGSNGSQIFSTIGIVIFAVFCHWSLQRYESELQHNINPLDTELALQYQQTSDK